MGKRYGYARVSSKGQEKNGNSLEDQENKIREAGCDEIVKETFTGTKVDRPKFTALIEKLEPGDTLIVTKLDRFARSAGEGSSLIKDLVARGVKVHILNMGYIEDTSNGRLILNVLLSFAEFERDMIVERTSAGKAVKRATDPNYKEGRKAFDIPEEFDSYREKVERGEITAVAACKALGVSRSTWYKWIREMEVA